MCDVNFLYTYVKTKNDYIVNVWFKFQIVPQCFQTVLIQILTKLLRGGELRQTIMTFSLNLVVYSPSVLAMQSMTTHLRYNGSWNGGKEKIL